MARIRTIKPEAFDDPDLCALPPLARWLFVGLWTQADKAGRLEDDPRRIKVRLLAYDDTDCDRLLASLAPKFITRYAVEGRKYIQINNFEEHQHPHPKEADSTLPAPKPRSHHAEPCNSTASPGKAGASTSESGFLTMDSGSRAGKDGSPEPSAPAARLKPLAYKPRIDVAWPGRPPVPSALHAEFVSKLGGDATAAAAKLHAWYPTAAAPYEDQPIGDDDWTFWRARFREWVGTTKKPVAASAEQAPINVDNIQRIVDDMKRRVAR